MGVRIPLCVKRNTDGTDFVTDFKKPKLMLFDTPSMGVVRHLKGGGSAFAYKSPEKAVAEEYIVAENQIQIGTAIDFSSANVFAVDISGNLTATAGGAQAGIALANYINKVTTVASANDSGQLPTAANNKDLVRAVVNTGANSMRVFPQTGQKIDNLAANAGFDVPKGTVAFFWCDGTQWWSVPVTE